MYVGPFFIDLLTQHGMAEVAKIANSFAFLLSFFDCLLMCCWDDLLIVF